ncbi:MAG TPA: DcaP family trimeric outer membrane transporter, partial [Niastella sp.]
MKYSLLLIPVFLHCILFCTAQDTSRARVLEVYGFVMTDAGYNFNQINPNWFDALRVNRLPTYKNQFGSDGNTFFGVRQSRFGVRGWTQTPVGELKTTFEFDLFGVGPDEGQTTMRIRHAYAEIGKFAVGQTNT